MILGDIVNEVAKRWISAARLSQFEETGKSSEVDWISHVAVSMPAFFLVPCRQHSNLHKTEELSTVSLPWDANADDDFEQTWNKSEIRDLWSAQEHQLVKDAWVFLTKLRVERRYVDEHCANRCLRLAWRAVIVWRSQKSFGTSATFSTVGRYARLCLRKHCIGHGHTSMVCENFCVIMAS